MLLTGLRLVRTGELCCDLNELLVDRRFDDIAQLVERKRTGHEDLPIGDADLDDHRRRFELLCEELTVARERSPLPARHDLEPELEEFVRRVRAARG